MADEKTDSAPVRFYAIGYGDPEGYWETFVFAVSPEEALNQYVRWCRNTDVTIFRRKWKVDVIESVMNEFGVLESVKTVLYNQEIEC